MIPFVNRSDSRDPEPPKLPALVLALGLAAAPHALRVPAWAGLTVLASVTWRLLIALRGGRLPPRALLAVLALGALGGVVASFGRVVGREAFLTLLVVLAGLKLLETHTERDRLRIAFLACVLVICHFLYSQSIASAAYMLGVVVVIVAAMVGQADAVGRRSFRLNVRLGSRLVVQALPFAVALFFLFPRVARPLWGVSSAGAGVTGLADSLAPGSITRVALSEEAAFRVEFDGPVPAPEERYWRGPVLDRTDGMRWWHGDPDDHRDPCGGRGVRDGWTPHSAGEAGEVTYTVTLEPHGKRWLLALDRPLAPPAGARQTSTLLLCSDRPVTRVRQYAMRSRPGATWPLASSWPDADPPPARPRVAALARQWAQRAAEPDEIVRQGLRFFREGGFVYTLSPPPLGADALESFLFDTRQGFCEHYAAAFAALMRLAGVPARVVTGYLGGEPNPVGGYLTVRQADAHAWVEVAVRGRGWVRVDPTAVVAPERLGRGIDAAASAAARRVRFIVSAPGFLRRGARQLRLLWDALNHGWGRWVRDYGPERQAQLLSRVGMPAATRRAMTAVLSVVIALLLVAVGAQLGRARVAQEDPVRRLHDRFCRKLARRGLARFPHEGPLDHARRVCSRRPDLAEAVRPIVEAYVGLRYGGEPATRQRLRRLAHRIRRLRP